MKSGFEFQRDHLFEFKKYKIMEDCEPSTHQEFCVIYNSDNFASIVTAVTEFLKKNKSNSSLHIQKFSHKGKNMIIQWSYIPFGTKKIENTTELANGDLLIIKPECNLVPVDFISKDQYRKTDNPLPVNADKKMNCKQN